MGQSGSVECVGRRPTYGEREVRAGASALSRFLSRILLLPYFHYATYSTPNVTVTKPHCSKGWAPLPYS